MNIAIAMAGFGLSLVISIVSLTAVVVTMKNNVTRLSEHDAKQEEREVQAAKELTELLVLLKSFMASQTEINRTVEMALTGVLNQMREMEKRTVESSTVVSLLTEVLKKGGRFQIEP